MSHRKRVALSSASAPSSAEPIPKEKSTEELHLMSPVSLATSLSETKKQLEEIRSRYRALLALDEARYLQSHDEKLRVAVSFAIHDWISEYAFFDPARLVVTVKNLEFPAIGDRPLFSEIEALDPLTAKCIFSCELYIYIALQDQRFLQPAIKGFVQNAELPCTIQLKVTPNFTEEGNVGSSMNVTFGHPTPPNFPPGTVWISPVAPFAVTHFEVFPPLGAAAKHLSNVLIYSLQARYNLLERVWALASFVLPGTDRGHHCGAAWVRKLFLDRLEFDSLRYSRIFGCVRDASIRIDQIGNRILHIDSIKRGAHSDDD